MTIVCLFTFVSFLVDTRNIAYSETFERVRNVLLYEAIAIFRQKMLFIH